MFAVLIYILAGLGAGVVTGLAGLSAAAVISPMLINLLGFAPFEAIGISLASDVLASALSAGTYARHREVDVKDGLWLLVPALFFTLLGCLIGYSVPNVFLGAVSTIFPIFLGLKFLFRPVEGRKSPLPPHFAAHRRALALLSGSVVGVICGFSGAGGGMMMLFLLTTVLGYPLKKAVGTSVFIMTFLALVGSVSHFVMVGFVAPVPLVCCALAALAGAGAAARFANRAPTAVLNRAIGLCLILLGGGLILSNLFF